MAWGWRQNVVIGWAHGGWLEYYSYTDRRNSEGVCGQVVSEGWHVIATYF
jgi:hypothetical protein